MYFYRYNWRLKSMIDDYKVNVFQFSRTSSNFLISFAYEIVHVTFFRYCFSGRHHFEWNGAIQDSLWTFFSLILAFNLRRHSIMQLLLFLFFFFFMLLLFSFVQLINKKSFYRKLNALQCFLKILLQISEQS